MGFMRTVKESPEVGKRQLSAGTQGEQMPSCSDDAVGH
jgi:hypothetical protein